MQIPILDYPSIQYTHNSENFRELLLEAFGANYRQKAASLLKVDVRTIRRWFNAAQRPPESVLLLLHIMAHGIKFLPGAGDEWNRWVFRDGCLVDDDNRYGIHTPGSIRAWWLTKCEILELCARENRQISHIENSGADNVVSIATARSGQGNALSSRHYQRLEKMTK